MRYETAIVTGASRGLGRAIASSLAARGLNVMLAARAEEELREAVAALDERFPGRAAYHRTDLRSGESIRELFAASRERFGPADVLVNNAGIGWYKPFLEWSEREIEDTVGVNLTALMLCCHAALPDMLGQRRGLIVNIASDLSRRYLPNMGPYTAAKWGALGFAGSLLREVKDQGVKVCTVMPGIIDTNFNDSKEGTRDETWSLRPAWLAESVASLLDQPDHVILDEIVVHPMGQEF